MGAAAVGEELCMINARRVVCDWLVLLGLWVSLVGHFDV